MNIRPSTLDEIVGLDDVKAVLKYDLMGAVARKTKLPHFLISSPPGLGKTTISHIIAGLTGGSVHRQLGTDITSPNDVYDLAAQCKDNDIIFLEEAHGMGKKASVALLPWMEEQVLVGGPVSGIAAPNVTFLFPTTNAGKLSDALRNRCKTIHLNYYNVKDLAKIIKRAAGVQGFNLEDNEALDLLAMSSRGTPRIAIEQRLETVLNVMTVDQLPFCVDTVLKTFKLLGVHPYGLESEDLHYCNTLYDLIKNNNGKPASFNTIKQSTGLSEDVVSNVVEPYLYKMSIIGVSTKGRYITTTGYKLLNKEPIVEMKQEFIPTIQTNQPLNKLIDLKDRLVSGQFKTMREIAGHYGLKYGPDNDIIKEAIRSCGFGTKQRLGIYKIGD